MLVNVNVAGQWVTVIPRDPEDPASIAEARLILHVPIPETRAADHTVDSRIAWWRDHYCTDGEFSRHATIEEMDALRLRADGYSQSQVGEWWVLCVRGWKTPTPTPTPTPETTATPTPEGDPPS